MFNAKGAAPALGIARHAIDTLIEQAGRKPARAMLQGNGREPAKLLGEEVFVQESLARAETLLGSARAYLFDVVGDIWKTLEEGKALDPQIFSRRSDSGSSGVHQASRCITSHWSVLREAKKSGFDLIAEGVEPTSKCCYWTFLSPKR
jgi:hypothetical protein